MLNGCRVDVRHAELALGAVDVEASKKLVSIYFYRNHNYCRPYKNGRRATSRNSPTIYAVSKRRSPTTASTWQPSGCRLSKC